jgi:hypothetical protein
MSYAPNPSNPRHHGDQLGYNDSSPTSPETAYQFPPPNSGPVIYQPVASQPQQQLYAPQSVAFSPAVNVGGIDVDVNPDPKPTRKTGKKKSTYLEKFETHDYWVTKEAQGCLSTFRAFTFKYYCRIFWLYGLLSLGLWLTIFVYGFRTANPKSGVALGSANGNLGSAIANVLTTIENNIYGQPMSDLIAVPANTTCPVGYTNILLFQWPGTIYGCVCPVSPIIITDAYADTCETSDYVTGCRTRYSRSSQNIYNWRSTTFCAKYITDALITVQVCPTGYLSCYTGGCIPIAEGCPITNITLSNGLITYTKDNVSQPIIEFGVSMGPPCLEAGQQPLQKAFPLLLNQDRFGCLANDPAVNTITGTLDSYPEANFFADGGMQGTVTDYMSYSKYIQNVTAQLVQYQRYPIANSTFCLNLNMNCFDTIEAAVTLFMNAYMTISIIGMCFVTIFFMAIYFTWKHRESDTCSSRDKSFCFHYLFFTAFLGSAVGQIIIAVIALGIGSSSTAKVATCKPYVDSMVSQNCFPAGVITEALTQFSTAWLTTSSTVYNLIIPVFIVNLIGAPFLGVYSFFYWKSKELNLEE